MKKLLCQLLISLIIFAVGCSPNSSNEGMVLLPLNTDPTISFRILFKTGSQNDPEGKEGLAALTASVLTGGSTTTHSYEDILEELYPMASSISDQVDKEITVFYGRTHRDNLDKYYGLLKEVLLEPAFKEEDFNRVKSDLVNYVQKNLRYSQDEVLGKEALYEFIFEGTAYGHNEEGRVTALNAITLDDVKKFYQENYTLENLVIGLGGGFNKAFAKKVESDFNILPSEKTYPDSTGGNVDTSQIKPIDGMEVLIVEKDAAATAISFGFPIEVKRGSRDFYALSIAVSWLGEHRNASSHLFQVIRERRGLNYGDYAYIEHFPGGHRRQFPPTNVARSKPIFQIWIRPVPNETRVFAFRAALRELQKLVDNGMSREDFELTKKFLKNYILHYAPTTMSRLGYALDDQFYGIKDRHWEKFARMLQEITLEDVNAAIKKHLQYKNLKAVFITADATGLKNTLVNNTPSPITYGSEKPAEILEEDKEISTFALAVKPENVKITPVDEMFER